MATKIWALALLVAACYLAAASAAPKRTPPRRSGTSGSAQSLDTTYHVLARAGTEMTTPYGLKMKLGAMLDKKGRPLVSSTGAPRIANNPDYMSFLNKDDGLYAVVQFETNPATYFAMKLEMDKEGFLTPINAQYVDMSAWEGAMRPCAGIVSPWNTHLSAEESDPNVRNWEERMLSGSVGAGIAEMMNYNGAYQERTIPAASAVTLGVTTVVNDTDFLALAKKTLKPYMWGHIADVDIKKGVATFSKLMAVGRASWEVAYVMPDKRTMYLNDDAGNSGGLIKFVADKANDFSTGVMYAAKFIQTNAAGSAALEADIEWVELSPVDAKTVLKYANQTMDKFSFASLFEAEPMAADGTCPTAGFRPVLSNMGSECLRMKEDNPDNRMLVAALETRRAVTYFGADSQMSKLEGASYSKKHNKLYMAISTQANAMTDNHATWDKGSSNTVKVQRNSCGCTYAMDLDSKYSATRMYPQVCGRSMFFDASGAEVPSGTPNATERGDLTLPCNPDNLSMMQDTDWLTICEDGSYRAGGDMLWAHNVVTKESIIIHEAEIGAEVASGYTYSDLAKSGYAYVTVNDQAVSHSDGSPMGYMGPWKLRTNNITFKPQALLSKADHANLRYQFPKTKQ